LLTVPQGTCFHSTAYALPNFAAW